MSAVSTKPISALEFLSLQGNAKPAEINDPPQIADRIPIFEAVEADAADCTKDWNPNWKVNVLHLTTDSVSQLVESLRFRKFITWLQEPIGWIENSQPTFRRVQELTFGFPPPTYDSQFQMGKLFSPEKLSVIRAQASSRSSEKTSSPLTPVDKKIGQIFDDLRKLASSGLTPKILRWKINVIDVETDDIAKILAALNQSGFRALVSLTKYQRGPVSQEEMNQSPWKWTTTQNLVFHVPDARNIPLFHAIDNEFVYEPTNFEAFNERLGQMPLTKNLKPAERQKIFDSYPKQLDISGFVAQIQTLEGIQKMADDKDGYEKYPLLALGALLSKKITENQFATICLLYSAIDQLIKHPRKIDAMIDPLFSVTNLPEAADVRVQVYHIDQPHVFDSLNNCYDVIRKAGPLFRPLISQLPYLEQCVFTIIPMPDNMANWSPMLDRINLIIGHFFTPTKVVDSNQKILPIPAFSMIEKAQEGRFKSHAVRLQPVLGNCTTPCIQEYRSQGIRPVQVGAPFASTRTITHHYPSGRLDLLGHDAYHGHRDAHVMSHEQLAIHHRIVPLLSDQKKWQWEIVDGELHNSTLMDDRFGLMFRDLNNNNKELVIRDMVQNSGHWRMKYGLTRADLLPYQQEMYERYVKIAKRPRDDEKESAKK